MTPVAVVRGGSPLVLGFPHTGTYVPSEIFSCLNANGRRLSDTDWHIDQLYDGLIPDVTIVKANFHRYVIDANRDPAGASLYPDQATTTLIPLTDFDGMNIWQTAPTSDDIRHRTAHYHAPYHAALTAELERVRNVHGAVVLYDCHSIRSHVPFLFDGVLPDFNIGTDSGATCAPEVESEAAAICKAAPGFSSALNGRFRGGWTTRHYGRPQSGFHAIQMELAQSTYLADEAAPWPYDPKKAVRLRPYLADILTNLAALALRLGGTS
ncbi:MAG: N-formylglutamate deformylase [Pseudomonadota bacterium]